MIQVNGLRKSFGSMAAVDGVKFRVDAGEVYGLLGPNGAGKTTTISMLCGLLHPDGGEILINGNDPWGSPDEVRRTMSVVPQDLAVYEDLTAKENLEFWGKLYDLSGAPLSRRVDEVLETIGLKDRACTRVSTYSGGMKRRLNLGMALIPNPKVLLLDEPTVGIDPQARLRILELVKSLAADGVAVLYTTHYMEEAQDICDRIGIMDGGKILATGTLEELTRLVGEGDLVTLRGEFTPDDLNTYLKQGPGLKIIRAEKGFALLSLDRAAAKMSQFLEELYGSSLKIQDLSIKPPTLQDVFIKLTGREFRN
ncbi:MAG: ABC transporter ATP-binding protein [Candidatus Eisenbacteria bacterium]|uniref:ABC transporter ATP-binding protein n=1 Tax=Eiseniibacteriota bacterium TaxID=2212470 RepID=A0A948W7Z3_UNCEI|nr:ABC transporter ATP-binding protein [Candidatus Eisenbacteria bacterium]MBU1948322.1 ABC transporter ATP-binding protein [Candidatus Eisenbacteria bacterium]MBU2693114.1 ABC transporter ATP-binding protein [Candidatus Eisenbacteria bacterium]